VFDEGFQPREPWQDVHMRIDGPAVFDIFKNFVRRWNSFAGYGSNALDSPLTKRWFESIGGTQTLVDPLARGSGDAIVQILRSVSGAQNKEEYATLRDTTLIDTMDDWKTHNPANRGAWMKALASWNGLNTTNILQAMRNCIQAAEAFIYIENQYFMSECGNSELGQKGFVLNPVVNDLAIKIAGAIYRGRPFHVYLVMPVHPEGKLEDGNTEANQYWQIQAIKHGTSSLYHRIKAALLVKRNGTKKLTFTQEELNAVPDSDVEQYVTVLNMRNFSMTTHYARDEKTGEINTNQMLGRYVITEQIYVHSKLLIVDDAVAIIGSANINDRSLMGNGDTELAAIVVDGSSTSRDAGQGIKVETRDFARNLRIKLWRKHLGMEVEGDAHGVQHQGVPAGINLDQPLSKATITAIKQLAKANASTYESVFTHTPRNSFKTLTEGRNLYPRGIDGPPPPLSDAYMANGTYQWQRPKNSQENFAEVQKQTQMRQQMQRDGVSIPAKTPYQDHLDIENRIMPPQIIEPFSYNGKIPNVDKAVKYLKSQVKGYWTLAPLDWGKGSDAGEKATRNVWIAENENHEKGSA
jgi:phospholipase D1/2